MLCGEGEAEARPLDCWMLQAAGAVVTPALCRGPYLREGSEERGAGEEGIGQIMGHLPWVPMQLNLSY